MMNYDKWKPSKYVYKNGKLIASRDPKEVGIGSRLIADLIAERYQRSLSQHAKGRLLDLGCGKVPLFAAYKNLVTDTTCVDWINSLHKNEYLDLECDLNQPLPFNDGTFDTIILSDVLEHIHQPELLWKEMFRILAMGGKILINVPFYYCLHECPHDYYRYTEFALRRFVENSGLQLHSLDTIGGAPEIMADIFAKNILRLPVIGRFLSMFVQWLAYSYRNRVKTTPTGTEGVFPFGYFLIAEKPLPPTPPT